MEKYFLDVQGYHIGASKMYQDNMGVGLLEKYGKALSGNRTNYINIRYFLVKDRVNIGDVVI